MLFSPTAKRFWSMILCGFAAAALFGLMQPLFHTQFVEFIFKWLGALGGTPLVASFVVAGLIWAGKAGYGRRIGFLGTKNFFKFPPLWLAVGVALASLYAIDWLIYGFAGRKEMCASVSWWIWDDLCQFDFRAQATLLVMVGLLIWYLVLAEQDWSRPWFETTTADSDEPAEQPVDLNELAKDVDKLIEWFENDDPITDQKQDAFGHGRVATRIADRLAGLATGEIDASEISTALIGPIGSGKSSIMRMVQEDLHNRPKVKDKVVVIDISMWPYITAEAAVQGVIEQITYELSKHINILGLRNTSRHYLRAIQSTGGWLGAMGHLVDDDATPAKVLKRLNDAAKAIGLNIVIWMEDQERFIATGGNDENEQAKAVRKGVAKLAPMHALLYEIDRCKNIGVVWADIGMDLRFDQHKVTRHQEYVPLPKPKDTWNLIWCLREKLLAGRYGEFIDAADEKTRSDFDRPEDGVREMVWSNLTERTEQFVAPVRAVAEAIETPRQLASVLRLFHRRWLELWGDIDIDDLLVMSILQCVKPEIVDVCNSHQETLSGGLEAKNLTGHGGELTWAQERAIWQFQKVLGKHRDLDPDPIRPLLEIVFPSNPSNWRSEARCKPQGVARHGGYWEAIRLLERPARSVSDQEVMLAIRSYVTGEEDKLITLMVDPEKGERVDSFARPIPSESLPGLFLKTMTRVIQSPVRLTITQREAPMWSFFRVMLEHDFKPAEIIEASNQIIDELLPEDLALAIKIATTMSGDGETAVQFGKDRLAVERHFAQRVVELYGQGDSDDLLSALLGEHDYLLSWTFASIGRTADDENFYGKKTWERFLETVMDAARRWPDLILPKIAVVLTTDTLEHPDRQPRLDKAELDRAFGRHSQEVLNLFCDTPAPADLTEGMAERYAEARRDARLIKRGEYLTPNDQEV